MSKRLCRLNKCRCIFAPTVQYGWRNFSFAPHEIDCRPIYIRISHGVFICLDCFILFLHLSQIAIYEHYTVMILPQKVQFKKRKFIIYKSFHHLSFWALINFLFITESSQNSVQIHTAGFQHARFHPGLPFQYPNSIFRVVIIKTCKLKLHLHTAINRADFVSWWMWFSDSPTKVQRHFLTNAFVAFWRI